MPTHSLEIPRDLHAKAKAMAAERGITLEGLLSGIVEDYASEDFATPAGAPERVERVRVRVGVTDADWDRASARARADRSTLTAVVLDELESE